MRIADGEHGEGNVLVSDDDGTGRWTTLLWYAYLDGSPRINYTSATTDVAFTNYGSALISSNIPPGKVDAGNDTITVPFRVKYRVTVSAHCMSGRADLYWARLAVFVTGDPNPRWTPSTWGGSAGFGTYPSFSGILNLEANDELRLYLTPYETFSANQALAYSFMVELIQLTPVAQ